MIENFQALEQNLSLIKAQEQQVQSSLLQTQNAKKELEDESYVFVGNILIKKSKEEIHQSLSEKEEKLQKRLETIQSQKDQMLQQKKVLEQKLMEEQDE